MANTDNDKLVTLATFRENAEAELVKTYLASVDIDCMLNDTLSNQLLGGYVDLGGIQMLVFEDQLAAAREAMKAGGFEQYLV
jgi:hypothetical protein